MNPALFVVGWSALIAHEIVNVCRLHTQCVQTKSPLWGTADRGLTRLKKQQARICIRASHTLLCCAGVAAEIHVLSILHPAQGNSPHFGGQTV